MTALALFTPTIRLFIESLYGLTAFISVTGNLIVLIVLLMNHGFNKVTRKFLCNLALSDVLMSIFSIPWTYSDIIYLEWKAPNFMCYVVHFITITCLFVSVYTLLLIAIDRYFSLCFPTETNWVSRHMNLCIAFTWILGIAVGLVQALNVHVKLMKYPNLGVEFYDCRENWPNKMATDTWTCFLFLGSYLIPGLTIAGLYMRVARKLSSVSLEQNGHEMSSRERRRLEKRKKVVKMLVAIVAIFYISWSPLQLFHLFAFITNNAYVPKFHSPMHKVFVGVFLFSHWLSICNSFTNPIIYCFMSDIFRADLRNTYLSIGKKLRLTDGTQSPGRREFEDEDGQQRTQVRPHSVATALCDQHNDNNNGSQSARLLIDNQSNYHLNGGQRLAGNNPSPTGTVMAIALPYVSSSTLTTTATTCDSRPKTRIYVNHVIEADLEHGLHNGGRLDIDDDNELKSCQLTVITNSGTDIDMENGPDDLNCRREIQKDGEREGSSRTQSDNVIELDSF